MSIQKTSPLATYSEIFGSYTQSRAERIKCTVWAKWRDTSNYVTSGVVCLNILKVLWTQRECDVTVFSTFRLMDETFQFFVKNTSKYNRIARKW
jgi:hypothetical protein